jgi:hypothetical protein
LIGSRHLNDVRHVVVSADVHEPDKVTLLANHNRKSAREMSAVERVVVLLARDFPSPDFSTSHDSR